jgi:hypothetical protein
MDAAQLVARIEEAMQSESWNDAKEIWDYIKSRRIVLDENLSNNQQKLLEEFITKKYKENIFILKKGPLEKYLPIGNRTKDVEKLILFLEQPNYWDLLDPDAKTELELVAKNLLITNT